MCDATVVPPEYNRGFDRKKGLAAKVFVMMTIVYLAALIPVSLIQFLYVTLSSGQFYFSLHWLTP
jgi:hypothetical protein